MKRVSEQASIINPRSTEDKIKILTKKNFSKKNKNLKPIQKIHPNAKKY